MRGNITKRGRSSFRLKFDLGRDANGARKTFYETVKAATRREAEAMLTSRLNAMNENRLVDPSKVTVAEYIRDWLNGAPGVSAKTLERYKQLAEQQIIRHLGSTPLQKLRPAQVQDWHATLLKSGGEDGRPISARTVGHAHRVLHLALERAAKAEVVARNVASGIKPPKVDEEEVEILTAGQMAEVLTKLEGHALYTIVTVALGTGMRRGEIAGLQWGDIDLDGASLRVERSVEETAAGMRIKPPKTKSGRRTISLAQSTVAALRAHRKAQLELRLALGLGRPEGDAFVFCTPDGTVLSPDDDISAAWRRAVASRDLTRVTFHALRHSHASALIAQNLDVVSISKRLGHSSPVITLRVYAHIWNKADTKAADAIERALKG